VDPAAERLMMYVPPRHVEAVWLRVNLRISIGGGEEHEHRLAATHRAAADAAFGRGDAPALRHRRLEAQNLLDGVVDQRGVGAQLVELRRVPKQEPHAVADEIGGGYVAGDQQQFAHRHDLVVVETIAGLFRGDQRAEQVVPRRAPPPGKHVAQVGVALPQFTAYRGTLLVRQEWIERPDIELAPALEVAPIGRVDAEHLGDDDPRRGAGERT